MERSDAVTTLEVLRANCSKHSRDYQALDYAISSLKTDEAYQIMYEGGEIFTKADMVAERKKIAEAVADKMDYMYSCANERNIILGIITGERETTESLCSTCKALNCVSNGTAISKSDYESRLKDDMVTMLEELKAMIEKKSFYDTHIIGNYDDEIRVYLVELDDVNEVIQEKINVLRGEEK